MALTKYEHYDVGTSTFLPLTSIRTKYNQQFTPSISHYVTLIKVAMRSYLTAALTDIQVKIYTLDGFGNPTGTALTQGVFSKDDFSTSKKLMQCFVNPYYLTAGTKYGLVIDNNGIDSNTQPFGSVPGTYAGGVLRDCTSGTWQTYYEANDLQFEEWGITSLTVKGSTKSGSRNPGSSIFGSRNPGSTIYGGRP
jgi:hypothetical protein